MFLSTYLLASDVRPCWHSRIISWHNKLSRPRDCQWKLSERRTVGSTSIRRTCSCHSVRHLPGPALMLWPGWKQWLYFDNCCKWHRIVLAKLYLGDVVSSMDRWSHQEEGKRSTARNLILSPATPALGECHGSIPIEEVEARPGARRS